MSRRYIFVSPTHLRLFIVMENFAKSHYHPYQTDCDTGRIFNARKYCKTKSC